MMDDEIIRKYNLWTYSFRKSLISGLSKQSDPKASIIGAIFGKICRYTITFGAGFYAGLMDEAGTPLGSDTQIKLLALPVLTASTLTGVVAKMSKSTYQHISLDETVSNHLNQVLGEKQMSFMRSMSEDKRYVPKKVVETAVSSSIEVFLGYSAGKLVGVMTK